MQLVENTHRLCRQQMKFYNNLQTNKNFCEPHENYPPQLTLAKTNETLEKNVIDVD